MGALYDLYKTPTPYGVVEKKGLLHARIVNGTRVACDVLLKEIADASTFTRGDLMGMLSAVSDAMARHLTLGDVVELEGLGYFSVSLKSNATAERCEVNSATVEFNSVHLRVSKEMKKKLSSMRLTRREKPDDKPELLPVERLALAMECLRIHVFMSRMDYQRITGCNKSMALRDLDFWVEASILRRYGSGKVIVYYSKNVEL